MDGIVVSVGLFQAKYSTSYIDMKDMKNNARGTSMTPLNSAKHVPNKLKINVFRDTDALQHIVIKIVKHFISKK